jgi:uncharacterized repeat protein (TIGR03803 family)
VASLVEGRDGFLYGTAYGGVSSIEGIVFKLIQDGAGYKILHRFSSAEGQAPAWSLIEASDGALYGTAYTGGANNSGTLFKLNKDGSAFSVVHRFGVAAWDGRCPSGAVVEGRDDGALYGTTTYGNGGGGTAFRSNKDGTGYTVLHSFGNSLSLGHRDRLNPQSGLLEAADGVLYGTTSAGGANGVGTVYRLGNDGNGYTPLYSFGGSNGDGQSPWGVLVAGSDGALYGTTTQGGSDGLGTIFRLNRDGRGYSVLYEFRAAANDGADREAGLVKGRDGAFYGTTFAGGDFGAGTVFRIWPQPRTSSV